MTSFGKRRVARVDVAYLETMKDSTHVGWNFIKPWLSKTMEQGE